MARKLYEGMFMVDSGKAGAEFPDTVRLIADILQRHGAEIERIEKWAERKFAYPIKRSKRGIYILTYFTAEGSAIDEIREDVRLNEELLRVLILIPEQVSPVAGQLYTPDGEEIEEPRRAPAEEAEEPAAEAEPVSEEAEEAEVSEEETEEAEVSEEETEEV